MQSEFQLRTPGTCLPSKQGGMPRILMLPVALSPLVSELQSGRVGQPGLEWPGAGEEDGEVNGTISAVVPSPSASRCWGQGRGGQRRDGDGRVWSSPLLLTVPAALKVRGGVGGWKECLKEACTAVMGIVGSAGSGRQE